MIAKRRRAARQRPVVRWHGGKFRKKDWILSFLPPHSCYVEPYGGGGSILIHKPKSTAEIYNDLDGDIVNLFRVLADRELATELIRLIELTPYSRAFFDEAYKPSRNRLTRAHRLVIRSFMGHGADGAMMNYKTGFRGKARRGEAVPAQEWANYPVQLREIVARIQSGVCIQQMDAIKLMKSEDGEDVLFFVDPPYLPETRSQGARRKGAGYHVYNHELSKEDHIELLAYLRSVKAMVVQCGYPSDLYDQTLPDWHRVETDALADGARPRTEVLWLNPAAWTALEKQREHHGPLFEQKGAVAA